MARPGFLNHRKFKKLVAITKLPRPYALGLMEMIWSSCYENGEPFLGEHASDVEHIAEWPGTSGEFVSALIDCGFVDHTESGFFVHDLHDHAPSYVRVRAKRESERREGILCEGCGCFFKPLRAGQKYCTSACRKTTFKKMATQFGDAGDAKATRKRREGTRLGTRSDAGDAKGARRRRESQKLEDFNDSINPSGERDLRELATRSDAKGREGTRSDATPAPAPAPAPAPLIQIQEEEIPTAHTFFCMGETLPEVPAEKESVCVPFSNPKSDPLKASESARKIVDLYREKINPRSLPRMGEREVFELLTGAIEVDPAVLVRSVENFAKFRIRMGPNPPYAPHASRFFQDRLWEAYADGVPDFNPVASNATPGALKSRSADLEKMLQDTKEVSARRTTNTKA